MKTARLLLIISAVAAALGVLMIVVARNGEAAELPAAGGPELTP